MKSLKDLKDNDGISLKAYTDILVNKPSNQSQITLTDADLAESLK